MKTRFMGLAALALLAGACAGSGAYVPEERATATLGGRTAARYPVATSGNAKGDVRIASSGIREVKPSPDAESEVKAVHVRLAVANSGRVPMTLDVREQRLQFPDGRKVAPAVARSPAGDVPVVPVPVESARVVDVYFPIQGEEDDLEGFDLVWRVNVGGKPVTEVTPFNEVSVDPAVARQQRADDVMDRYPYWYGPGFGYDFPYGW